MIRVLWGCVLVVSLLACDSDFTTPDIVLVNLGIAPVTTENMNTSYHKSKTTLAAIDYSTLPAFNAALLHDAVAYLDADGDSDVDIFFATGDGTSTPYDAELYINAGDNVTFAEQASTFMVDYSDPPVANVPQSLRARKALVSDFNLNDGNNLDEIFVLDSGVTGAAPKLILHQLDPNDASVHYLRYQIYSQDVGEQTTGASADIDNDDDADIFVGGTEPFFYINNGFGGFNRVNNRWDDSMSRIDAAELVDVDMDGYVDLLAGADEANDATYIYWGNSTGTYTSDLRTLLPAHTGYGVILDFEVENLDGDSNKDIVIYRTSATDTDRVIQIIKNNGGRSFALNSNFTVTSTSSAWLRAQDWEGDTDIDIFPDNAAAGFRLENDGSGVFTQIP